LEYTDEQLVSFKQQFALSRRRQIIMVIPLLGFFIAVGLLTDRKTGLLLGVPRAVTLPAFFLVLGAAILFSLRNWRCPACKKYLGSGRHRFCSNCGVALK
jgi:hypothetical protein